MLAAVASCVLIISGCSTLPTASDPGAPGTTAAATPTAGATPVTPSPDTGTPVVRPAAHYTGLIASTALVGTQHHDFADDPGAADAKRDRWTLEAACSTRAGAGVDATASYAVVTLTDAEHPDPATVAHGDLDCTSIPTRIGGLRLHGQPVQVDITVGTKPVGSFYGVVHASA